MLAPPRACKGHHAIVFRTPFGKLTLDSPRLYRCRCEVACAEKLQPFGGITSRTTSPELAYLETKFAALASYGLSVKLLQAVLPIGHALNTRTIRRQVRRMAECLESELDDEPEVFTKACLQDAPALLKLSVPLVVGLDGVYVHENYLFDPRAVLVFLLVFHKIPVSDSLCLARCPRRCS
jgi:hypothetical protein